MGFSGVHAVRRINGLAGSRIIPSTCIYRRGSLAGSLGGSNRARQIDAKTSPKTGGASPEM